MKPTEPPGILKVFCESAEENYDYDLSKNEVYLKMKASPPSGDIGSMFLKIPTTPPEGNGRTVFVEETKMP